jgi:DNA replication protein DnaC
MKSLFPKYADKTLEDFQILDPSHEVALQKVKNYTASLIEMRKAGHGLTFLGPVGVGKTYLAEMVLKAAQETVYQRCTVNGGEEYPLLDKRYLIESITADSFIGLHQATMNKDVEADQRSEAHQEIRRIESVHFVLFDDVGREHLGATDWSSHLLFNVLRYRSNRRLPFLVTSNLSLVELKERYDEGFTSLLHGDTDIIVMEGEDFRCRRDN